MTLFYNSDRYFAVHSICTGYRQKPPPPRQKPPRHKPPRQKPPRQKPPRQKPTKAHPICDKSHPKKENKYNYSHLSRICFHIDYELFYGVCMYVCIVHFTLFGKSSWLTHLIFVLMRNLYIHNVCTYIFLSHIFVL